jgi:hypothetical protein
MDMVNKKTIIFFIISIMSMTLMKSQTIKKYGLNKKYLKEFQKQLIDKGRTGGKYMDWVSVEYLDGNNIGKRYRVRMRVSVGKKGYGIEFENGKSLENNGNKKRDISYISHFKCVGAKGFEPTTS